MPQNPQRPDSIYKVLNFYKEAAERSRRAHDVSPAPAGVLPVRCDDPLVTEKPSTYH